ncbi:MAG: hypothetical protein LBO73_04230 [Holosporaceae bacterium]|nr:hypothetical protein [Holosporaceae bacterium]
MRKTAFLISLISAGGSFFDVVSIEISTPLKVAIGATAVGIGGMFVGAGISQYSGGKSREIANANLAVEEQHAVELKARQAEKESREALLQLQKRRLDSEVQSAAAGIGRHLLKLRIAIVDVDNDDRRSLLAEAAEYLERAKNILLQPQWGEKDNTERILIYLREGIVLLKAAQTTGRIVVSPADVEDLSAEIKNLSADYKG